MRSVWSSLFLRPADSGDPMFPDEGRLELKTQAPSPMIAEMPAAAARAKKSIQTKVTHVLRCGDARELDWIPDESVHLVLTSPPYWTLKEYPANENQLGLVAGYDKFHDELDKVWRHCFRVLVPGGR